MPLPGPSPIISSTAVDGFPIADALFPRVRLRRIVMPQAPADKGYFEKRAAEHLDYSADLTPVLEKAEIIVAVYAWTSVATELLVTSVRFGTKAVMAFVFGGLNDKEYELFFLAKTSTGRIIEAQAMIAVSQSAAEARSDFSPTDLPGGDPAQWFLTDVMGEFLAPPYVDSNGNLLFEVP